MRQQIAVYLRLSLEDVDKRTNAIKDESNSISAQRLLINRHIDQDTMLCNLPRAEFCDDGFSGTNFERPDFARMLELTRKGEISCIVVKDLSRFGRDYLEVGDYLEHIFPFLGIRFISINDQYDSERHKGQTLGMDVAFKNLIYDYYSKDLSQKVKSAMGMKQKEACYVSCVPYGYKVLPSQKHQLIIDEATAPVVRRIFTDIAEGQTCTSIAKALNTEGVLTPAEYKNTQRASTGVQVQWTHRMIYGILGNIKYTGMMVNHTRESRHIRDKNQRRVPPSEWYFRENAHDAIVSQDEFDAAQTALRRRHESVRKAHDLSDRVFYCGYCGGKLEKRNDTVFACASHRYHDNSSCENVHCRKEAVEEVLFEALKAQVKITGAEVAKAKSSSKSKNKDLNGKLNTLKGQYETLNRDKLTLYEEYRDGKYQASEYLELKTTLNEKQSAIKTQLDECEAQLKEERRQTEALSERQTATNSISALSDEKLREHLYDAIERVIVYSADSIEIIWRFDKLVA